MDGRKKRVLVVSQHYWPENFRITDICKGFLEDGIECDVLCGLAELPQGRMVRRLQLPRPAPRNARGC